MGGIGRYLDKSVGFFIAEKLGHITNNLVDIEAVYKGMQEAFKIGWQKLKLNLTQR